MSKIRVYLAKPLFFVLTLAMLVSSVAMTQAGIRRNVPLDAEKIEWCQQWLRQRGIHVSRDKILSLKIEAENWECKACHQTVSGLRAEFPKNDIECPNCGKGMQPKTGETYRGTPAQVAVPEQISREQVEYAMFGGADWDCTYCNVANRNKVRIAGRLQAVTQCQGCGAPRPGHEPQPPVELTGAPQATPLEFHSHIDVNVAPEVAQQVSEMGVDPSRATVVGRSVDTFRDVFIYGRNKRKNRMLLAGGLAVITAFGTITGSSMADRPITGTVESAQWTQTVRIERFEPVVSDHRVPRASIQESEAIMPTANTPGKPGQHALDCDANGMCFVETHQWVTTASRVSHGDQGTPVPTSSAWSGLEVPADGRQSVQTSYHVQMRVSADGESLLISWEPENQAEFQQLTVGRQVEVQLSPLRHATSVEVQQ